jgi:hypothetical protein
VTALSSHGGETAGGDTGGRNAADGNANDANADGFLIYTGEPAETGGFAILSHEDLSPLFRCLYTVPYLNSAQNFWADS